MLNQGLEMNMRQEGFGRETLTNIVNNLYNVANMRRTEQVTEAETPSINVPGLPYKVTRKEAVEIATAEPPSKSELDRYLGENPGKTQEDFYRMRSQATDDMRNRFLEDRKAGKIPASMSLSEYARQSRPEPVDPGDRAYEVDRAHQKAHFTSQKFLEEVSEDPKLVDFESTYRGKGVPGDIEYDNAFQKERLRVIDERIRATFPLVRREWDGPHLVWKDPEMGIVHME